MFALGFLTWPQGGGGISVALAVGPRMERAVEEEVPGWAGSRSSDLLHSLTLSLI